MIVVWSTFTPLSAIISSKYRYLNGYFKYHLTFNKIISPTKCFHLKELDSMSLPLISFLFYYILCRYFLQRNHILPVLRQLVYSLSYSETKNCQNDIKTKQYRKE